MKINLKFKDIRELASYGVFGVLTTLINILSYIFLKDFLNVDYLVSNALAWVTGVFFAYVTNKLFVFNSRNLSLKESLKEFELFILCRASTGMIDMVLMFVFISIFGMNDKASKIIDNIIIILLNYVFSKCFIFKKREKLEAK